VTADGIEGEVEAVGEVDAQAAEPKKASKTASKKAHRPRAPRAKSPAARKS
jgi:hypothetical protein